MATEKQMDFFRSLFLAEDARTTGLRDTAKTYLTLSAVYSAFVLFVTEKMKPVAELAKLLFAGTVSSTLLAFLLSLVVIQVARFQAPSHPDLVFGQYGDAEPSDAEFYDDRIVNYSVAYEANSLVNDRKARLLGLAGAFIFVGLALHAAFFCSGYTLQEVLMSQKDDKESYREMMERKMKDEKGKDDAPQSPSKKLKSKKLYCACLIEYFGVIARQLTSASVRRTWFVVDSLSRS